MSPEEIHLLFEKYKSLMYLDGVWDINLVLESISEYKCEAYSQTNPTYYSAKIVIDLERIRDENHLKKTIIHELLHCVLSRLDTVLEGLKSQMSSECAAIIENEFDTETERTIVHLERIVENCEKECLNNNA